MPHSFSDLLNDPNFFSYQLGFLRYRDCIKMCNLSTEIRTKALKNGNLQRLMHQKFSTEILYRYMKRVMLGGHIIQFYTRIPPSVTGDEGYFLQQKMCKRLITPGHDSTVVRQRNLKKIRNIKDDRFVQVHKNDTSLHLSISECFFDKVIQDAMKNDFYFSINPVCNRVVRSTIREIPGSVTPHRLLNQYAGPLNAIHSVRDWIKDYVFDSRRNIQKEMIPTSIRKEGQFYFPFVSSVEVIRVTHRTRNKTYRFSMVNKSKLRVPLKTRR
jgi:hypothetical protein